jgi:hypothetical protein
MPADDGSKRCLCDRADRLVEVLNRNNGSDGILDPEVRDGGHVDRHIVFGDDACDWIGIVTIRSDTRCTRSMRGAIRIMPGPRPARFVSNVLLLFECVARSLPRLA